MNYRLYYIYTKKYKYINKYLYHLFHLHSADTLLLYL